MSTPIKHDQFEPLKLIAVTERLHAWVKPGSDVDLDMITQVKEDLIWLLDSHLRQYHALERAIKAQIYYREGDDEISWRDHAETLQEDLSKAQAALEMIATPMRPDGTYNLERRACELLAKDALS